MVLGNPAEAPNRLRPSGVEFSFRQIVLSPEQIPDDLGCAEFYYDEHQSLQRGFMAVKSNPEFRRSTNTSTKKITQHLIPTFTNSEQLGPSPFVTR
jgi:hypothetical protein